MPANWVGWLCLMQISMATLCLVALRWQMTTARSVLLRVSALWFLLQAADELVAGNFFGAGIWEYPILLWYFASALFYIRRHEPKKRAA